MSDITDMEDLLAHTDAKVNSNVNIVTPELIGQDYLIHISMDTALNKMTPYIGMRQGPQEDRTLPRICVSSTLIGAMCGYAAMEIDFLDLAPGNKLDNGDTYKGGMKIYALPFKVALDPNKKLVYDAEHTDEYWLVSYNKETISYKPEPAGKMFYRSMTFVPRNGKKPAAEGELYVEITKEDGLQLTRDLKLDKGHWVIEGTTPQFLTMKYKDATIRKQFKVKKIDRAEFMSQKKAVADMLSLKEPATIGKLIQIPKSILAAARADKYVGDEIDSDDNVKYLPIMKGDKIVGFLSPKTTSYKGQSYHRTGAIFVMSAYRGEGLASKAIREFYVHKERGLAYIEVGNVRSQRAFEAAGFVKEKETQGANGKKFNLMILDRAKRGKNSAMEDLLLYTNPKIPAYLKW